MRLIFTTFILLTTFNISAQNTGIGTSNPSEKLEVSGNIKVDTVKAAATNTNALKIPTGAATGSVLSSDADGAASWTSPLTIPGTIASSGTLNGSSASVLPSLPGAWEFIGPTATVALNGKQWVFVNCVAALGRNSAGNTPFRTDVGYQLTSSPNAPLNASLNSYSILQPVFTATPERLSFSSMGSFKPSAGTYRIGAVVSCTTTQYFNNNNYVNGYYMIVNE